MTNYPHIASRVFNRPHLVEPNYGRVFIGALADRLDIRSLVLPDGTEVSRPEMRQAAAGYGGRGDRAIFDQVEGIAIIPIEGTLVHRFGHLDPYSGMTGYDGIQQKLEAAFDDQSIRGVLLDIDSPGGEVSGCFDLADLIYEMRQGKPIWALADELCCSAAFSLASAASRVIVPRTAEIGSVGVLTAHVDYSEMLKASGLEVTLIFAGDHKVDGNPYEPLPDSVRADIQAEIDALYAMFATTVARNRAISEQAVRDTQARVYSGASAVEVGFADAIMPSRDVLTAFDEYLNDKQSNGLNRLASEVYDMSLSLFNRGRKKAANSGTAHKGPSATDGQDEDLNTEKEGAATDEARVEVADDELTTEGGGAANDPPEEEQAASAETVVAMCAEAKVDGLAHGLIQKGMTVAEVQARIRNASDLRDVFAAAKFPHLADAAIKTGMDAGFARTLLTELTAAASGQEIDHRPPQGGDIPKASFNAVQYYRNR